MQLDLMAITRLTLLTYVSDVHRGNQLLHGFEFPECTQTLMFHHKRLITGGLCITVIAIRGLTVVFWALGGALCTLSASCLQYAMLLHAANRRFLSKEPGEKVSRP